MPPTTGLLSQAIQNLQGMSRQLTSLTGLPPDAQGIETSVVNLLQAEITKVIGIQSAVKQFVTVSLPPLQQAKTDLDNNTNTDQIASIITQVNSSGGALKQNVDALSADIKATKGQIIDILNNKLAPIENQLNGRKINLNTELQSAQQEAESIRNTEKYFLALGLFGLIGLAAAGIALLVQEGKVNGLQAQASGLRAQIAALSALIQSVHLMVTDFGDVVNKISNVANAVNFVASDNSQIINDLKNVQGDKLQAKLYILTAISQVQTLGNDAA